MVGSTQGVRRGYKSGVKAGEGDLSKLGWEGTFPGPGVPGKGSRHSLEGSGIH